jgi:catechol 2,3-dioxygenase-like lactoylglutathione lyase family enzyme
MPHGLDHIVHAARDLDAAAEFYRRIGFTVGARNRHPWGTHNRIVQLGNAYIELLEVAEPEKIPSHGRRSFSFGAFNRDFLTAREGLSMLILGSSNAAADARAFEAVGIGGFDVFEFSREGRQLDGTEVKLAFSGCGLCDMSASFSAELLGFRIPDSCQRRQNHAGRGAGRRQSD